LTLGEPAPVSALSSNPGPSRTTSTPWLLGHRPSAQAAVRLLCFPYAGGAASLYQTWSAELPDEVDVCAVQLPGRQERLAEQPFVELDALLDSLDAALAPLADLPWALFGHSFGGLLAFEYARLLRRRGRSATHLFVAGLRPPQVLTPRPTRRTRADDELLAEMRQRAGNTADGGLDRQLADLVLPAYRADLMIMDRYALRPEPPLAGPLSVFGGAQDTHPIPAQLPDWGQHTRGRFRVRVLPGGHFFLDRQRAAVQAAIVEDLGIANLQAYDG
jgi:medium-chain acyl-[acyl-carrier-protein] hydrolase